VLFRNVSDKEDMCTKNCLNKFLKMTQRISTRFQEHQLLSAEAQGATISGGGDAVTATAAAK
jgi:import inner membrane translocase subunit TIM9